MKNPHCILRRKMPSKCLIWALATSLLVSTAFAQTRNMRGVEDIFNFQNRIVGGTNAPQDRFPSVVALFDAQGTFACGGYLILPDVVLSAAHCTPMVAKAEVGRYDLAKSLQEDTAEAFDLIEKRSHPAYGQKTAFSNDMDFALFKLGNGGTQNIPTGTINGDVDLPRMGDAITVVGWGTTSEGGLGSSVLQEVDVNYMSNDVCQAEYSVYNGYITDDMFCANVKGGGKDACQGDSGGPAFIKSPTGNPALDLFVGVVSWGVGCARAEFPGVYGRPAFPEALEWIERVACSMSGYTPCPMKVKLPQLRQSQPPTPSPVAEEPYYAEGACYVHGTFEVAKGECGTDETACLSPQCEGSWLMTFPNCFLFTYRISTHVPWCKASGSQCQACGGVYIESPPALTINNR